MGPFQHILKERAKAIPDGFLTVGRPLFFGKFRSRLDWHFNSLF